MRRGQGKVFGLNEQHVQSSGSALEHVLGAKDPEPSEGVRNEGLMVLRCRQFSVSCLYTMHNVKIY